MAYTSSGSEGQLLFWFFFAFLELLRIPICYPTRATYIKQWVVAPAVVAIATYVYVNSPKYVDKMSELSTVLYLNGNRIAYITYSVIYLIFLQPNFPTFWRRVKDGRSRGSEKDKDPLNFSFWRKIEWGWDLQYNARGVGWTHEPTKVLPPHPNSSRLAFICSRLFKTLPFYYLMFDLGVTHQFGNPSFDNRAHQLSDGPETYIARLPLLQRIPDLLSWALTSVGSVTLVHNIWAIVSVGLWFSKPVDWPHVFGSFRESYTVRRFWGISWHQLLRIMSSSIGKHIGENVFNFKPGTNLFYFTQLYITFFLIGIVHAVGDHLLHGHFPLFSLQFFLLQAIGISIEQFVMWLTTPFHSKLDVRVYKAIGYIWVVLWFCWTAPMFLDPMSTVQHNRVGGVVFRKLVDFWKS